MKLKCCNCNKAKKGEVLWKIDGEYYCSYCAISYVYNRYGTFDIEPTGYVGEEMEEDNAD